MKMKKLFPKLLLILLAIVSLAVFAACDDNGGGDNTDGGGGDPPETDSFSVTFVSDGETSFSEYNLRDVPYGSKISKPDKDPFKKGHVFRYWYADGGTGDEFRFDTDVVTKNLVLKAKYDKKDYVHTMKLFEDDAVQTYEGHVSLPENGEMKTTYDSTTASLPKPTTDLPDDYFVYWYYYNADNERVQLTTRADKTTETLSLVEAYKVDAELTVYAMWYSYLPEMTVTYKVSEDAREPFGTETVKQGERTTGQFNGEAAPTKTGYEFDYWYYITGEGENAKEVKFVFASPVEGADNQKATVVSKDMVLFAKWKRSIEINSAEDIAAIRATLEGEDEAAKTETRNAVIRLKADLTLQDFSPLFSIAEPFNGVFDGEGRTLTLTFAAGEVMAFIGASSGDIKNLTVNASLTAAPTLVSATGTLYAAGLIGYNSGSINDCAANLTFNASDCGSGNTLLIGALAALSSGSAEIYNCTGTLNGSAAGAKFIQVGALVGRMSGGSVSNNQTGDSTFSAAANNVFAGGLVGNLIGGTVKQCAVGQLTLTATGNTESRIGGFAGNVEGAIIKECYDADKPVSLLASAAAVYGGGMAGVNCGYLSDSHIDAALTVTAHSRAIAGGVVGFNLNDGGTRGSLSYVYAEGIVTVTLGESGTELAAGGISGKSMSNTSSYAFSCVDLVVNATDPDAKKVRIGTAHGFADSGVKTTGNWYDSSMTVTLNGATIDFNAETPSFELTKQPEGTAAVDPEDLKSASWVETNLKFSAEIWKLADMKLPLLIVELPEEPQNPTE